MDKEKELPKRKDLRLKQYDYSSAGAYFVTICTKDRKRILSDIVKPVGVGAFDDPKIRLKPIGKIVEKYLLSGENISGVKIDRYVIMPDHIHAIIFLYPDEYAIRTNGSSEGPLRSQLASRKGRPLPTKCYRILFLHSSDFAIKRLEITFFNEDMPSILFVIGRITKQESNTFMKTLLIGVMTNCIQRNNERGIY